MVAHHQAAALAPHCTTLLGFWSRCETSALSACCSVLAAVLERKTVLFPCLCPPLSVPTLFLQGTLPEEGGMGPGWRMLGESAVQLWTVWCAG